MKYGCIGKTLQHSFSKEIHLCLRSNDYTLCELDKSELDGFMKKRDFDGINVTIPYKQSVIPYLDFMSDKAKTIGAVNTVRNRDGILYGYNTDYSGMATLAKKTGIDFLDKKVLILGTGGTSKTARAVATDAGAKEILFVSREKKDGCVTYSDVLRDHRNAEIIINTTPCGMYPHGDGMPIDPKKFGSLCGVIDAVYNPLRTRLVLAAREIGVPASGGLYMLVMQAIYSSEIFTDTKYTSQTADKIFSDICRRKENIVLTGMPGSGKTTVGKHVSMLLSRSFTDTDALIVQSENKSIPDIFKNSGETGFRKVEKEIIRTQTAPLTGKVIATGGGAVLSPENITFLRQNGRIYFLKRPLSFLIPTADRPCAFSFEEMERRYNERDEIYHCSADCVIEAVNDISENADKIIKEFTDENRYNKRT